MKTLGVLLLACGAIALFFGLNIDTTVATDIGARRVHNIGLMSDKQNVLLVGAAIAVVGAVLFGFGFANKRSSVSSSTDGISGTDSTRHCPYCAEVIKVQAIVCRFCNRDLPLGEVDTVWKENQPSKASASYKDLMTKHGITFDGVHYRYGEYKYDRFETALEYAKLQAAKGDA